MERIRSFLKAKPAEEQVDFLRLMSDAEGYWYSVTGNLYFDRDMATVIVEEFVKERCGQVITEAVLPIVLSKEEAVSIAKALGGDDKAVDLKAEICAKAATAEEAPIKEELIEKVG